jgi:hypothetical protein
VFVEAKEPTCHLFPQRSEIITLKGIKDRNPHLRPTLDQHALVDAQKALFSCSSDIYEQARCQRRGQVNVTG